MKKKAQNWSPIIQGDKLLLKDYRDFLKNKGFKTKFVQKYSQMGYPVWILFVEKTQNARAVKALNKWYGFDMKPHGKTFTAKEIKFTM